MSRHSTGLRSGGGPSLVVGLTGGIASGKSSVAVMLADRGAVVIDADEISRQVVEPGTPVLRQVVERFGDEVLRPDGTLDRAALGRVVFADAAARRDLEAMIHPAVRRRAAELEAAAPDGSVVVHVIPLLVETGQADAFDAVVVVDVDPTTQLARVQARDGLDDTAARARVSAQSSREDRLAAADIVLPNSATVPELERSVDQLWRQLVATKLA